MRSIDRSIVVLVNIFADLSSADVGLWIGALDFDVWVDDDIYDSNQHTAFLDLEPNDDDGGKEAMMTLPPKKRVKGDGGSREPHQWCSSVYNATL